MIYIILKDIIYCSCILLKGYCSFIEGLDMKANVTKDDESGQTYSKVAFLFPKEV